MSQSSVGDLVTRLRTGLAGARQAPAEAPRARLQEGDLRHVAILFLDVRGFTGLAEQLNPDDLSLFIHQTVFQAFSEAIADHAGVVLQFLGDAIYAIFPPVLARIDPRDMAARAAWTILGQVRAIEPICREADLNLEVRIGLNYGKIALSRVQVGERHEWTGAGDAINVAKRLETAAPVNSAVVLGDFARAVSDRFEFRSVGFYELKGKAGNHELFALGPPRTDLVQTASAPEVPLVGRDAEQRQLAELLGCERSVALVGEAGVGKSRLLDECISAQADLFAVRAQCVPYGRQLYGPLGGWLRGILRRLGLLDLADCLSWDLPPDLAAELAGALPVLQACLAGEALEASDPQTAALRIKLAFLTFFRAARQVLRGRRLLLRGEDIQWLDEGTAEALRFLLQSDLELDLVVTSREPVPEGAAVLPVAALSCEDTGRLLRLLLRGEPEPDTAQAFVERSGGNPFALGELVAEALRRGILLRESEGWTLTEEGRRLLPDSLEGAVLARV
ncbi:MAG: adenylate/guanylate cyclase domain-containing protein, partial [Candidatus Eremiobacterota bacterium]